MAYQSLGLGAAADDGTGDTLRDGGDKINDNFLEIYTKFGSGTILSSGITATSSVVTLTAPIIATSISHADNVKAYYGTGNDLEIFHDASSSYISDTGTGSLYLRGTNIVMDSAAGEKYIDLVADGAVTLYYDNSAKIATDASGVDITGQLDLSSHLDMPDSAYIKLGTGDDLQIYHDGSNSLIDDTGTGSLFLRSGLITLAGAGGGETMATFADDGAVTLYYDNGIRLVTDAAGVDITGQLDLSGAFDGGSTIAVGYEASASGSNSSAFGYSALASGTSSTAIGYDMTSSGNHAIGFGYQGIVSGNHSTLLQLDTTNRTLSQANSFSIMGGNVGIGTLTPSTALSVTGALTVTGNSTVGGTLGVTGNTTVGGTLSVTGTVTATPTAILLIKDSSASTLKTINGIAAQ